MTPAALLHGLFLFSAPAFCSGLRSFLDEHGTTATNESALVDAIGRSECGKEVTVPSETETLQQYFDGLRVTIGLLDSNGFPTGGQGNPEKCTKKDVCLLMRQLDMDFYERARAGTLTDHDYDNPPEAYLLKSGNCENQQRGFKMRPILDADDCEEEAVRVKGARGPATFTNKSGLPYGCVVARGKIYVNMLKDDTAMAGVSYSKGRRTETIQICEMDRSLEESAAAYYSPYKMKPSMLGREAHSTSCSFGMYAFLAKLRQTSSHCAKILTYATSQHFHSAQDALNLAAKLESSGQHEEAGKVRNYVESIRQKFVLIDTISNHWCPDIWTAAMASPGATCAVPRLMSWTQQGMAKVKAERKASSSPSTSTGKRPGRGRSGRKGGRGGRLGAAMGDQKWQTVGNANLLGAITEIISSLTEEDSRASGLLEHKDDPVGKQRVGALGRADKIALEAEACEAFDDVTLKSVLAGVSEAPPDFFENAYVEEE